MPRKTEWRKRIAILADLIQKREPTTNDRAARVLVVQNVPIVQDVKDIRNRFECPEPAAS